MDNNTPDEETWRPLEEICRQLGPQFRYVHLDQWPGYKSGALNFTLAQTAPDAEIIGNIDADYQLDPSFLRELVPPFADPEVAFIQTPQDYRRREDSAYSAAIYHSYKYFAPATATATPVMPPTETPQSGTTPTPNTTPTPPPLITPTVETTTTATVPSTEATATAAPMPGPGGQSSQTPIRMPSPYA